MQWHPELLNNADPNILTVLVGNKADQLNHRNVTKEEADSFAMKSSMYHLETSACDDSECEATVDEVFQHLLKSIPCQIMQANEEMA